MDRDASQPESRPDRLAIYSVGYGAGAHRWHSARTAADRAGFLLPYLRPGLSLLDCGCGPGSITLGLAEAVAPGRVVGVDREPRQIERARSLAAEHGVANARFVVADAGPPLPLGEGRGEGVSALLDRCSSSTTRGGAFSGMNARSRGVG